MIIPDVRIRCQRYTGTLPAAEDGTAAYEELRIAGAGFVFLVYGQPPLSLIHI